MNLVWNPILLRLERVMDFKLLQNEPTWTLICGYANSQKLREIAIKYTTDVTLPPKKRNNQDYIASIFLSFPLTKCDGHCWDILNHKCFQSELSWSQTTTTTTKIISAHPVLTVLRLLSLSNIWSLLIKQWLNINILITRVKIIYWILLTKLTSYRCWLWSFVVLNVNKICSANISDLTSLSINILLKK